MARTVEVRKLLRDRLELGDLTLDYVIEPYPDSSRREQMEIVMDFESGLRVRVPYGISLDEVRYLLDSRSTWILSKWRLLSSIMPRPQPRELTSGEKFPYLGRRYFLKVVPGDEGIQFFFYQGKFWLKMQGLDRDLRRKLRSVGTEECELARAEVIKWYRSHALSRLTERVERYAKVLNVSPRAIALRDLSRKWATCTPTGRLHFNWRIILAPLYIVDYVVVHELVHLIKPGHSDKFWEIVKAVIPDMEERREWLRIHGPTLVLF